MTGNDRCKPSRIFILMEALRGVLRRRIPVTRLIFIVFATTVPPCLASAKRFAPKQIEPVIRHGIRYVAPNSDGRRADIEPWDVQTNKELWDLTGSVDAFSGSSDRKALWRLSPDERVTAVSGPPNGSESRSKPFHKNLVPRIDS
jgi:hypothetical protein